MKKLFYLTNICNLFLWILLFISTYIIYEVNINTILLFIGVIIFEISMFIVYLKCEKEITVIDYLINSCYFIFVIFYLLFIIFYQYNNSSSLNIVYFSKILFIPHFIYAVVMCF